MAKLLSAADPRQLRVVVVHQPLAVTQARDRSNLLRGHDVATRAWSAAGADVVISAHDRVTGRRVNLVKSSTVEGASLRVTFEDPTAGTYVSLL